MFPSSCMWLLHKGLMRITNLAPPPGDMCEFSSSSRLVADGVWWMQTIPLRPARRFCGLPRFAPQC